jgi:hypothetical protein
MLLFPENTTRRSRERSSQLREHTPKRNRVIMNTKEVVTPELKMKRTTIVKREKQAVQLEGRRTHRSLNNSIVWQIVPMGQITLILIRGAINFNRTASGAQRT